MDQGDESGPLSDDPVLEYTVVIARGFLQDSNGEIHSTITPKVVILLPQPKKTSYSGVEIDKIAKLSRFSDWLKDSCKPKNQDPSFTSHMQIFTSQSVFDDYFNNSLRIAKASLGTADSPETRKTAESAARRDIEFTLRCGASRQTMILRTARPLRDNLVGKTWNLCRGRWKASQFLVHDPLRSLEKSSRSRGNVLHCSSAR